MFERILRNQKMITLFFVLFGVVVCSFQKTYQIDAGSNPYEENEGFKSNDGDITYNTKMLTATSSITYGTIGWIIRLDEAKGSPIGNDTSPKKGSDDYAVIYYTSEGVGCDSKPHPNGFTYSLYTFPKTALNKAIKQAGPEFQKKWKSIVNEGGGTIYLNGIFTTYHGGVCTNKKFYRHHNTGKLKGIYEAEPWRDPSLFWQYYDIKVEYEASDFPVSLKYMTDTNEIIYEKELGEYPAKELIRAGVHYAVAPETLSYGGGSYQLYRSYFQYKNSSKKECNKKISLGNTLQEVQYPVDSGGQGIAVKNDGVTIIFKYKPDSNDYEVEYGDVKEDSMEKDFPEIEPKAVIQADNYKDELFNVNTAIPSSESVYVQLSNVPGYVTSYHFTKIVGKKKVKTTVKRNYTIYWDCYEKDEEGNQIPAGTKSKSATKSYDVELEIPYGYWVIDYVYVYRLDKATIKNGCLPNGKVILTGNTPVSTPVTDSTIYGKKSNHIFLPETYQETYIIDESVQYGTESDHKITYDSKDYFEYYAAERIPYVHVKNDRLTVDGTVVMDDALVNTEGPKPRKSLSDGSMIGELDYFKDHLTIPATTANDCYSSKGTVTYVKDTTIKKSYLASFQEDIPSINDVYVHTPVVCNLQISDEKAYNQMIHPDQTKCSLVLGRHFNIKLTTMGKHNDYLGYGTQSYQKYTDKRQIQFPFGVYQADTYYEPYDWITVDANETQFYLPPWVHEGIYDVKAREISINAKANDKIKDEFSEESLNSQSDNYIATDLQSVQVSGRLYDLQIYDITSYPLWQEVFRVSKDSLRLNGFTYRNGMYNQNNVRVLEDNKFTFPLVNGSHPQYKNEGVIKKGYFVRFKLKTIGDMYHENDIITMKPHFFFVPYDGSSFTQVDLYYNETVNQKRNYLVKVGDETDQQNIKYNYIGNPYWDVNESVLRKTANLLGIDLMTFKETNTPLYHFGRIELSKGVRTFIGNTGYIPGNVIPVSVGDETLTKSVQEWYGEYYLPSQTYAVPYGFDLSKYVMEYGALDLREDFWLKDGYIVVNVDITTKEDNEWNLSYINKENRLNGGYCNMWELETGANLTKIDRDGNHFAFRYGDFIMYDANGSVNDDYSFGGTH